MMLAIDVSARVIRIIPIRGAPSSAVPRYYARGSTRRISGDRLAAAHGFSISRRISSIRHAVVRGPSLTGFGNRPVFIPAHQVLLLTGIGPRGAKIDASRTKPVSGSVSRCAKVRLHPDVDDAVLHALRP